MRPLVVLLIFRGLAATSNGWMPLGGGAPLAPAPGMEDPEATFARTKRETDRRVHLFPVTCETVGGEVFRGMARFDDGEFFYHSANGSKKKVSLEEVKSIEYQKWSAATASSRADGAPTTFLCRRFQMELRSGKTSRIYEPVGLFDRFRMEGAGRKPKMLYGYFVDSLRQGKWVNTGGSKKSDPGEKPLPAVVKSIRLEDE